MSYRNAELILPKELLQKLQEYAQGQYLYIPKKPEDYKEWGKNTAIKKQLKQRDNEIYYKYISGTSAITLADEYYLSLKSIQRILLKEKNKNNS